MYVYIKKFMFSENICWIDHVSLDIIVWIRHSVIVFYNFSWRLICIIINFGWMKNKLKVSFFTYKFLEILFVFVWKCVNIFNLVIFIKYFLKIMVIWLYVYNFFNFYMTYAWFYVNVCYFLSECSYIFKSF